MSVLARLIRFGGLQVLNAIAPILVLPAVIRAVGVSGWVGFSVGFALGALVAVAINFAWPIMGPSLVAGRPVEEARLVFRQSLVGRVAVSIPAGLSGVALAMGLSPDGHSGLAVATTLAVGLNGLAANWYFVGRGEASGILHYETLPKLMATLAAVPAVTISGSAVVYPALLASASIAGVALSARRVLGGWQWGPTDGWAARLRGQLPIATTGVLSSGSTAMAVPVAALSAASLGSVAVFASGTRLRSMAQAGVGASTSALQGWVSEERTDGADVTRGRRALLVNVGVGVMACLVLTFASPWADRYIFGPSIQISPVFAVLLGLTTLCYATSASLTNHVLAPAGLARAVVRSTLAGSVLAIPGIYLATPAVGAVGAMGAVLAAEALVVVLQLTAAQRRVWSPRDRERVV